MSNPVKLSICIATYNRGKFIGETLDSILSQIQPSVELIVVDGASPDNTAEVMARYLLNHPEIRYYREATNSGVDRDYDKAVGYAAGEYCWLMTDDDLLSPGAVSRVLVAIDGTVDLVVVSAQMKTANLSKELHLLSIGSDKVYTGKQCELFFSEMAGYLSFIGCVVIRRSFWMKRDRTSYFGTLFVHVGVIFQTPPVEHVRIISDPLIVIRYGNAMWSARGFEIWMFIWPKLIWAFGHFSDEAKSLVCPLKPWMLPKNLVLYRAIGAYSITEYRRFILNKVNGKLGVISYLIAIVPARLVNSLASLYCLLFNRKARSGVYDFARSRHATWLSRIAARILDV